VKVIRLWWLPVVDKQAVGQAAANFAPSALPSLIKVKVFVIKVKSFVVKLEKHQMDPKTMNLKTLKNRQARQLRVRKRIRGTTEDPRLHVFRSNRYTYAQIINDETGKLLLLLPKKN
jgi:hypothetical protein